MAGPGLGALYVRFSGTHIGNLPDNTQLMTAFACFMISLALATWLGGILHTLYPDDL